MRLLLLLPIFFLHLFWLSAQSPSYVHYGVSDGLPSKKVYCAMQDHRGFIWFGTDKGLARFDGTRFQVYGVKEGLPDPEVLTLFEDSHHRLWISCFSHSPCYMQDGRIVTAKTDSVLAKINFKASLWQFSEDSDQNVWIAGKAKFVYVFDGKSVQMKEFAESVMRVEEIDGKKFAFCTVSILQNDLGFHYDVTPLPIGGLSIAISNTKVLYALTNTLILLEWVNGKIVEHVRIDCSEGRVFSDKKMRFWHCTDTKGAMCYEVTRNRMINTIQYLPDEHVNGMMEDNQGTLWFCTGGNGVFAFSPGKAATFTKLSGLQHNNITSIACPSNGRILAGDDGGFLYSLSGRQIQTTALSTTKENNRCRQIIPFSGDTNWIATDKGLYWEHQNKSHKVTSSSLLYFSGFKTILAHQQKLWYGNHYSLGVMPFFGDNPRMVIQQRTTALGNDDDENIWAGSLDGLYSGIDSFQYNWGDRFPKLKTRIVAIQNAGAHRIWVVTPDGGLLRGTVEKGCLTALYCINDSLPSPIENIQSVYIEPKAPGRLWLATNSGVYGLNPSDWSVTHFDEHDGLADNDVNCALVTNDTLWAGTPAGLSCLPLLLQVSLANFGTFATGLHYQYKGQLVFHNLLDSISLPHKIELPPDAAMVTLNLAGLNYRHQGSLVFECITSKMLPPVLWWTRNNLFAWINNGFGAKYDTTIIHENSVNFGISLPSGSFLIKVTAVTPQGTKSEYPDEWLITIRPYWYNTLWFDLLLWGVLAYIIWRALRARLAYRKLNNAVSDLQLQALQSQINPHFVGNSINSIQQFFYPPNPAAASNYIELFTRLLRRTIILSEQHFNDFEAELAYDRDYLQMIQLRFGERFQFEIVGADTVPRDLPFPSMLLQPILENATIHGLAPEGASKLILEFSYQDKKMKCSIQDNGIGYKASKLRQSSRQIEYKSKGLELMVKKVEAFNQMYGINLSLKMIDLSDRKSPGMGTRVEINFTTESIKQARNGAVSTTHKPIPSST